ncbi:MAG: leucine-rich repeat domain-containing protein, partial [Lachnospiraceae bacterium]|nr:leucine-rich repeat domain-containing protein [Lachnospiraceae bacterium]
MAKKIIKKKKKHLRLKRGARRTIAALLMVTALIVAAIPAPSVRASDAQSDNSKPEENSIDEDKNETVPADSTDSTENATENATESTDEELELQAESTLPYYDTDGYLWVKMDTGVALKFEISSSTATLLGYDYYEVYDDEGNLVVTSKDSIEKIKLPGEVKDGDGNTFDVTGIGKCSGKLKTFEIDSSSFESGDSVAISAEAFDADTNLSSFIDDVGVITEIGAYAFRDTTAFQDSFEIPASVTTIGTETFSGSAVQSISFAGSALESLESGAFMNASSLETVDMANCTNLETLKASMFEGCTALTKVTLPASTNLATFNANIFSGCTNLAKVENFNEIGITSIPDTTFDGCENLESIYFPETLTSLPSGLLTDCTGGKLTYIRSDLYGLDVETGSDSLLPGAGNVADNFVIIGYAHQSSSTEGEALDDPSDLFTYAENYGYIFMDLDSAGDDTKSYYDGNFMVDNDGDLVYINPAIREATDTTYGGADLELPDNVYGQTITGIAANSKVFQSNSALTSITLPATIKTIDADAFNNAQNLATVIFPSGTATTSIGSGAFEGTASGFTVKGDISSDYYPFTYCMDPDNSITAYGASSSTYIEYQNVDGEGTDENPTFTVQYQVKDYDVKEDTESSLGFNTLVSIDASSSPVTSADLPSGIESNGGYFKGITALTSYTAAGLKILPDFDFEGCTSLATADLTFDDSETVYVGYAPFKGCSSLSSISAEGGNYTVVDNILYADDGATVVQCAPARSTDYYQPSSSVTEIYPYAFYEVSNLVSFYGTSGGFTVIPKYCFYGSNKLKNVTLGS